MKKLLLTALLFMAAKGWAAAPPTQTQEAGGTTDHEPSITVAWSPVTTAGRLYVCGVYLQTSTGTITGSDGTGANTYNLIGPIRGTNNTTYIMWTVLTQGAFSFMNANFNGSYVADMECAEYTGMAASSSTIVDCSTGTFGNSSALSSANCTPTASNDLIFGAGGTMANSITYTAGSGFTVELQIGHSTQGNSMAIEDQNATTCSSQSASMTASGSNQWSMAMAAFKTSSPGACSSAPAYTGSLMIK